MGDCVLILTGGSYVNAFMLCVNYIKIVGNVDLKLYKMVNKSFIRQRY